MNQNCQVASNIIELALETNIVKDFINKAVQSNYEYGYSETVWLLCYLFQKVLPSEVVNALFDEEIFAVADPEIMRHPQLRITMEEYRKIWECFVYATSGDKKGLNVSNELLREMIPRQKEWVIALLALGIVVPNGCTFRQVSLKSEIRRGYQEFLQTDIAKLILSQ